MDGHDRYTGTPPVEQDLGGYSCGPHDRITSDARTVAREMASRT
jgi:hypothetical protein